MLKDDGGITEASSTKPTRIGPAHVVLHAMTALTGFIVNALDGEIGTVTSLYFDDGTWIVRFLVVQTRDAESAHFVLVSPECVTRIRWAEKTVDVSRSRREIADSPAIDTDKPVARQHELDGSCYSVRPVLPAGNGTMTDPHLRGSAQVIGYQVIASDHASGHVADFLFDDQHWTIQSMLADVRTWLPCKRVVVGVHFIDRISWSERKVYVNATRDAVHTARSYEPSCLFS